MLSRIFRQLWFIYGITVFLLVLCVFIPISIILNLLLGRKARKAIIFLIFRVAGRIILFLIGAWLKVKGKEHFQKGQQYIVLSNHQSALDIMAGPLSAVPLFLRSLGKAGTDKIPLIGGVFKHFVVYVNRGDAASRAKSVENLKKTLSEGFSIQVYPEGSRNRTEEKLTKFYDGGFRIAIQTQKPILVQTLVNARDRMRPTRPFQFMPGVVHIIWSTPIETKGLSMEDLPMLKEKVRAVMLQNLG
ncbi:MAG: hypothetical protein GY810_18260 [Aureispira sp.]|nr:hypothetical protein [Aureispira sp.]